MKPSVETEIKLKVCSPRTVTRRLRRLGFRVIVPRHIEKNILFDFEDRRLRKAHCLLRLRSEGSRNLLTFKGAPRRSKSYKIRQEIEVAIQGAAPLRAILEAAGLREMFCYEKFRTTYSLNGRRPAKAAGFVLCDETPIGTYLELEGPARWIDRMARALGYGREDYITASYGRLFAQHCRRRRLKSRDMVFRTRKS